jgi:hypothetical protein
VCFSFFEEGRWVISGKFFTCVLIIRVMAAKAFIVTLIYAFFVVSNALGWGPSERFGHSLCKTTCKEPNLSGRSLAAALGSFALSLGVVSPAFAANSYLSYTNSRYHTSIEYPADYEQKVGTLSGERTVVAFTDPKDPDTSASIVFTPIAAGRLQVYSIDIIA